MRIKDSSSPVLLSEGIRAYAYSVSSENPMPRTPRRRRNDLAPLMWVAVASTLALLGCTSTQPPRQADVAQQGTVGSSNIESTKSDATPLLVQRRDFTATYRLDGVVQRGSEVGFDVPSGVRYQPAGELPRTVRAGEAIGRLVASAPEDEAPSALAKSEEVRAKQWVGAVQAPVGGRLELDQNRPRIVAEGIDVVVTFTPLQEMRFRSMRYEGAATVETPSGQFQAACKSLWLEQPPAGAPAGSEDTTTSAVAARAHCRLPGWVETAVGLRARLALSARTIKNALLVPTIAVRYDNTSDSPFVTVIDGGGSRRVPVVLGATDGVMRVVDAGLREGQALQRAQS